KPGSNVITVTARDTAGNTGTASITVTATDDVAPTVAIVKQNGRLATTASAIAVSGTAADAFGVAEVTWSTDKGASGIATGTTNWSVADIPVPLGDTVVRISARDAAGRVGTDTVTVTRTDGDAPSVAFVTPSTTGSFVTTSRILSLAGTATDTVGVSQVTWS